MNIRLNKPKRYKIKHIRKGDGNMFTYNSLLDKHSNKLWDLATKASKYNSNGKCTISKDDEDFTHDVWDELYPKEKSKGICK